MDILKSGKFCLILLIGSCTLRQSKENISTDFSKNIKKKSIEMFGNEKEYNSLYSQMSDSLESWMLNDLYEIEQFNYNYKIDSVYAINVSKTKLIGIELHFLGNQKTGFSDGIQEFYGAKIDGKWYFWTGGYTPVLRDGIKRHDPKKPLSYEQLHESAIGSLGGYLDANGNVRDEWFEAKFRGDGWTPFKDRYKYDYILDGKRIDNEKEYWDYIWKKKGQMLWRRKAYQDSIAKVKNEVL